MSQLSDKINSYALERGIAMEEAFSITPTRTGTNALGTFIKNTGTLITYTTDGPLGGGGSWNMPTHLSTSANTGNLTNSSASTNELLGMFDGDWSIGFWLKINTLPQGTSNNGQIIFTLGSGNSYGAQLAITGSSHSTNPSQLLIDTANSLTYSNFTFTTGVWYYVAIRRTNDAVANHFVYINGTLVRSFFEPGTGSVPTFRIGSATVGTITSSSLYQLSNFYLAPSSVIDPTAISEIWTAGSTAPSASTNITITETPAIASVLISDSSVSTSSSITILETPASASVQSTESTLSLQFYKTVIATPITASCLLVSPLSAVANSTSVNITTMINISASIPEPFVNAETSIDVNLISFSAFYYEELMPEVIVGFGDQPVVEPVVAQARLVEPPFFGTRDRTVYVEGALTGSGNIGINLPVFNANYRNIIKKLQPSLFLNNPASATGNAPNEYMNDGYENWGPIEWNMGNRVVDAGFPMTAIGNGKAIYIQGNYPQLPADQWDWGITNELARQAAIPFNNDYNDWTFETWIRPMKMGAQIDFRLGNTSLAIKTGGDLFAYQTYKDINGYDTIEAKSRLASVESNRWALEIYDHETIPGVFNVNVLYENYQGGANWTIVPGGDFKALSMDPTHVRYIETIMNNSVTFFSYYNTVTGVWSKETYNRTPTANEIQFLGNSPAPGITIRNLNSPSVGIAKNPVYTQEVRRLTGGFTGKQHFELKMIGDEVANDGWNPTFIHAYTKTESVFTPTIINPFPIEQWSHIAVTVKYGGYGNGANIRSTLWINGVAVSVATGKYINPDTPISVNGPIIESSGLIVKYDRDPANPDLTIGEWYNEDYINPFIMLNGLALYKKVLTNSDIIQHYDFVSSASPNRLIETLPGSASASIFDASVISVANINFPGTLLEIDPAIIVNPIVSAGVDQSSPAEPSTANASMVYPSFVGNPDRNYLAVPALGYAELSDNAFVIDSRYYSVLSSNVSLYRYVNFDSPTSTSDLGTDLDYANATPFTYSGTINLPYQGINNNSLVTSGSNYQTSGLILNESEYNDTWGTDENGYHLSFWIKKTLQDTNSNGLRTIANLYSEFTGHYAVLYQYGQKLRFELHDPTNNAVRFKFESSSDSNVFDGKRNNIVINFDNSMTDNIIKVYVNNSLVMNMNVGTRAISLINGTTNVSANSETYNKPRLSVGCLITPLESTELPTTPTASIIQIDEVYWSKSTITEQQLSDIYNSMPGRVDNEFLADFAIALTATLSMPSIGTGRGVTAPSMVAAALTIPSPVAGADRTVSVLSTKLLSSALLIEPFSVIGDDITHITVQSDIFVAGIELVPGYPVITIAANVMLADATIGKNIGFIYNGSNFLFSSVATPLIRYARVDALNAQIPSLMEVK